MWYTSVPQIGRALLGRFVCKFSVLLCILALVVAMPFAVSGIWAVLAPGAAAGILGNGLAVGIGYAGFFVLVTWVSLVFTNPKHHRIKDISFDLSLENTEASRILADLCDAWGVKPGKRPGLYLTSRDKFAYSVRAPSGRSLICISSDVKSMPHNQLKAVLAHELGHIIHHDSQVSTLAIAAKAVLSVGRFWALILLIGSLFAGHFIACLAICALMWGLVWAYNRLFAVFSRAQEYLADAAAAKAVGWSNRSALLRALVTLRHVAEHLQGDKDVHKTISPSSLRSHPTWQERARALRVGEHIDG